MSIHRFVGAALLAIGLLSVLAFAATAGPPSLAPGLNGPMHIMTPLVDVAGNAQVGTGIYSESVLLAAMTRADPPDDPTGEGDPPVPGDPPDPDGGPDSFTLCSLGVTALPICFA